MSINKLKPGEILTPMPRKLTFNANLSDVIAAIENGGGIARGPLIQDEKPVHLHISGGPWARGVIDGKNCWV